jgi:Flp pilus assembly protein TadG
MKRMISFRRKPPGELGQSIALMAIVLPAFLGALGLAMDVGTLYFTKYRLQTAVDSAALAGATCIAYSTSASCGAGASTVATNYASGNGIGSTELTPNPVASPTTDATYCTTWNCKVTVSATRTVPFHFARLVGVPTGTVDVTGAAIGGSINTVSQSPNLLPIGLQYNTIGTFSPGASIGLVYQSATVGTPGDWGWLSYDPTGAKAVVTQIQNGYTGTVTQQNGTLDCSNPANQVYCTTPQPGGGTSEFSAVNSYRDASSVAACSGYTWAKHPDNSPCAVTITLVDWTKMSCSGGGRCGMIPVLGFAEMWITGVTTGSAGTKNITAVWITDTVPGGYISPTAPAACGGPTGIPPCDPNTGTGAVAIQLIQ